MYHLNCEHWQPFVSQISDKLFTETIQKNKYYLQSHFPFL